MVDYALSPAFWMSFHTGTKKENETSYTCPMLFLYDPGFPRLMPVVPVLLYRHTDRQPLHLVAPLPPLFVSPDRRELKTSGRVPCSCRGPRSLILNGALCAKDISGHAIDLGRIIFYFKL